MYHLLATPRGITLAGVILAKRNSDGSFAVKGHEKYIHAQLQAAFGKKISPQAIGYIKRGCELLAQVPDHDLENAAYPFHPNPHVQAHRGDDFSILAKGHMMFSLTGLNGMGDPMEGRERLLKMQRTLRPDALLKSYGLPTWEELAKDAGDDSGDDEDDDSGNGDGGDDDASDGFGDGNSHYNPDEPRIPAGQLGAGQWTTAGNGTSTDSGSISADDIRSTLIDGFNNPSPLPQGTETAANNTVQSDASTADNSADNKQSATGTLVRLDNLPLENSRILPYFDASIADQIYSFFEDAENQGIPLMMTSGFRTSVTQSSLTGNQYGGAAAGSSLHEAGFAFDINWQDLTSEEQEQILDIAADNDLEWGGVFRKPDVIHFYADPFDTLKDRQAAVSQAQQQYKILRGKNQ